MCLALKVWPTSCAMVVASTVEAITELPALTPDWAAPATESMMWAAVQAPPAADAAALPT